MSRPLIARIDLNAIRHNYVLAQQRAPNSRALAVIKADAYGHGIKAVSELLLPLAAGFALLDLEEAIALREKGFQGDLVLLEGAFSSEELPLLARHRIHWVIKSVEELAWLNQGLPNPLSVFLKINTGMNRLGIPLEQVSDVLNQLQSHPLVQSIHLMTHFATADDEQGIAAQWNVFSHWVQTTELPFSASNSAALFRYPETYGAYVRPGILLYGASPFSEVSAAELGLKPAMCLESQIIGLQTLKTGDQVGYGATFTAPHPMKIGIVACGYADGYPRHAETGTPILVENQRTRTLGRVSMDMLAVDLTSIPSAHLGSRVVLWGHAQLSIDEVAAASGTIGYELMCGLARRVPVHYEGL